MTNDGLDGARGVLAALALNAAIYALLYGFVHVVSFVATIYEQDSSPRRIVFSCAGAECQPNPESRSYTNNTPGSPL